jgi:hypothetical protein
MIKTASNNIIPQDARKGRAPSYKKGTPGVITGPGRFKIPLTETPHVRGGADEGQLIANFLNDDL